MKEGKKTVKKDCPKADAHKAVPDMRAADIAPKPPSDEGGGKTEGFDGGREMALISRVSPSVSFADSSLVRGSLGPSGDDT